MNYRSIADLNATILANLAKIPRDIDLVVGIPRSGLLAANMLALHLNLPMTDLSGFIEGSMIEAGRRAEDTDIGNYLSRPRRALVVDDSVFSGHQMREARRRVEAADLPHSATYAAVYVRPQRQDEVDIFFEPVPSPRLFEWNLMHNLLLGETCVDIDGVLCRDPRGRVDDDGERFRQFIAAAEPLFLPSVEVGWLVTCRLEKYRELTEAWLAANAVKYGELIMLDLPSKEARVAARCHASFKASVYESTNALLFIESSLNQALEIARLTGKCVFCMETRHLVYPSAVARHVRTPRRRERRRGALSRLLRKLRLYLRGR